MKPTIHIHQSTANPIALSEICAGLEEEGVPYEVIDTITHDTKTLAHNAANNSRLHVGIGITANAAALQIRNNPPDKPIFEIELGTHETYPCCRNLGINAARAVKGDAFR